MVSFWNGYTIGYHGDTGRQSIGDVHPIFLASFGDEEGWDTEVGLKTEVLLLDEPVNGLDAETKAQLSDILCGLDISYVLISHDLEFLNATTHVIYTMQGGRVLLDQAVKVHEHIHAHPHGTYPHRHE